ncbi:leucine-rich repeat domain-containing protein [Breznakia pachnodae]|uniref:Leucine-rich repeat (LRR) protein n=1 Tax=Breznakia pachnodae TaxID=265178 RepID=A0ABU0E097_9FIRM|nr:leucine-rich repeat domain-containing protein [Breznakia pachnodae]MDQ0360312.1 Leucine-rich repeat (LRR) protein [Breznakia pachnodae]
MKNKKSNMSRKVLLSLLAIMLSCGLIANNSIFANDEEVVSDETNNTNETSEEVISNELEETSTDDITTGEVTQTYDKSGLTKSIPADWAFTDESKSLNDAIVNHATYGSIDTDGDGYITKTEAATLSGRLDLQSKGITGTLDGIQYLTGINQLYLNGNALTGSIPSDVGNLTSLTRLWLQNNQLTGSIPNEVENLISLQYLYLNNNQLTGSIPTTIGNLTSLQYLNLSNNQLGGGIPTTIGSVISLRELSLNANQLTGSIPSELGSLVSLTKLHLTNNQLSGSIPSELGNLRLLTELNLGSNQLSGSIPTTIGGMTSLITLNMDNNQLTGSIPTTIGNLTSLTTFRAVTNQLSGSIPSEIGNLTSLTTLYLTSNQLSGSIPTTIGNLTSLQLLNLSENQLSGTIPSELGNLTNLKQLQFYSNQLSGSIPSSFSNLTSVNRFRYHDNESLQIADLSGMNSLVDLSITKATNANLSRVTNFYVTGSKSKYSAGTRLVGNAGAFEWDSTTGYYVINAAMNAEYYVAIAYTDVDGNLKMISSSRTDLSAGGLMDNEGNLILGANLTNVDSSTGTVNLPNGGTIVTGNATYTFEGNTIVGEDKITTAGTITIANNITDGEVVITDVTTVIKTPNGTNATITLNDDGGVVEVPAGSVITDNEGNNTYLTGVGKVSEKGNLTTSDTTITVPADKVSDITTDGGEVTFPSGVIVDDGSTSITYPGTIIYDTDDNTLTYLPVDGLFNEDGTLKDGVTQEDITNSQDFVTGLEDSNLKTELQSKIDEAQRLFNEREAQKAVDDLFDDEDILNDDVTQDDIKNAQDLVNKLPEGDLKNELNDRLKDAQKQLDERNFVIIEAFKVFTGEGTVYTKIDAPVEKFSSISIDRKELDASNYEVTSGSTVITLSEAYLKTLDNGTYDVDVEFTSGAVVKTNLTVKVEGNPSKAPSTDTPTISKPSVDANGSSTKNGNSVDTGDTTDMTLLYGMLAVSLLGIVVVYKRKKVN